MHLVATKNRRKSVKNTVERKSKKRIGAICDISSVVSTKTKNDDDIIDIVKSDQRCLLREGPSVVNEKSYKNTDVISENLTSSNHFDTDDDQELEGAQTPSDQPRSSLASPSSSQSSLMLSAAERQELAENAMEQLATGLNKAAQAMQTEEAEAEVGCPPVSSDLGNLEDRQLFQLLEEAYDYRGGTKDRDGKSEMFRELLEKAEENSSGEEQWDINFRKYITSQDSAGKKKKKRVSESNKKGGSLSNLSCLSDFETSACCKSSSKNKKSRSSVSSRSREGGSLPPTKFENMFEAAPASSHTFAWDTGGQVMPEEGCLVDPEELQPLLHSTSDSQIRRRDVTIDMEGLGECDTDSNKTEVEEIEMVDMEGREREEGDCDGDTEDMFAARHRLETRHDLDESDRHRDRASASSEIDENGNPTSGRHIHPIMSNAVRPVSIYRHTPVFRPQKLTVPHVQNSNSGYNTNTTTTGSSSSSSAVSGPPMQENERTSKTDPKRKPRRKKDEEKNVVKAEDIEGYRGNTQDLDSLLQFIDGEENKKKSKKASDKVSEKNTKKVSSKSDIGKDDQKLRKKKEKSQEKDLVKPSVTKKLSIDTVDNDAIEEDVEEEFEEKRENSEDVENSLRASESPEKEAPYPSLLETVSAPSSNDSGHVSGGPCSLPSISSTKEMSIASSPPLDIDPIEFSEENYKDITDIAVTNHNEFTKVTKKQRKKKKRGSERVLYPQTSHEDETRSSSQGPEAASDQAGWFRGYRAIRGSREAVTGTKSTCSVPPSEASDTDDHDSVHSLPVGSTRTKVSVSVASVSSGHTPHASYADIARHAAALQTQQQGQQQHAVYREQLQYRENTPATNKDSVSSNDSNDYFYNPDLDSSFPPVQFHSEYQEEQSQASHSNNNNNTVNIAGNNNSQSQVTETTTASDNISDNKNKTFQTNCRSQLRQNKSESSLSVPPVVILQKHQNDVDSSGFTFGFEVNESLLAMSFENEVKEEDEEESDTLNDSDNIDIQLTGGSNNGLVSNQTYQDNEMMKKLLLCSNNCQEDDNGAAHGDDDDKEDSDDADVIVESHQDHSLKSFYRQVETLENLNFNYDVILKFVKQGWEVVNKEMKNGSAVCYYTAS